MTLALILKMSLAALAAVFIYIVIGFIPGTDETSVLMPISLAVILSGLEPLLVLSFFMASMVSLNLSNSIPTALVGLPGGVMSSPMMEHSIYLKNMGLSSILIKKMAASSLISSLVSLPVAIILSGVLGSYAHVLKEYSSLLFIGGAIFLSLMSKNKLISLLSITPLALMFMSLREFYWSRGIVNRSQGLTTSFFLAITIGPLLVSLLELLAGYGGENLQDTKENRIVIPKEDKSLSINPFKNFKSSELKDLLLVSIITNFLFVLSPVGLSILFGELSSKRKDKPVDRAITSITTMSAVGQASYISGLLIPLLALGIPLSPTSIGPGGALFNAPPIFNLDRNMHHLLGKGEMVVAILIGGLIGITLSYYIVWKYSRAITIFVLKNIPQEAILGLFLSLAILIAHMDAGFINIFAVFLIGLVSGSLNKMGVNYGVQFMSLYAAPWIIDRLILL